MRSFLDPRVDYLFKRLFGSEGSEGLCAALLEAVLSPPTGRRVTGLEILNPFTHLDFAEQKMSAYDVRARDAGGRHFDLGMQRLHGWVFRKRGLHYGAEIHGRRMQRGDYHETTRPTTSVLFLAESGFAGPGFHKVFHVRAGDGELFDDSLEIHTIELPKIDVPLDRITTPLEQWCYVLNNGGDLDPDEWPARLTELAIRQAVEVLVMLSQDEREQQRLIDLNRARLMENYYRDHEKIHRGLGREEGKLVGQIQAFESILLPATPEPELLALSTDDLTRRLAALQQQIASRQP